MNAVLNEVQEPEVTRGSDSELVNELASRIGSLGVELADVAGAGHMVAGDRNDAFNDAVVDFLARVRPS